MELEANAGVHAWARWESYAEIDPHLSIGDGSLGDGASEDNLEDDGGSHRDGEGLGRHFQHGRHGPSSTDLAGRSARADFDPDSPSHGGVSPVGVKLASLAHSLTVHTTSFGSGPGNPSGRFDLSEEFSDAVSAAVNGFGWPGGGPVGEVPAGPPSGPAEDTGGRFSLGPFAVAADLFAPSKSGPSSKLQRGLFDFHTIDAATLGAGGGPFITGNNAGGTGLSPSPIFGDYLAIDAMFEGSDGAALFGDLVSLGLSDGAMFGNLIPELLPVDIIDELAGHDSLGFARPSYTITNAGPTASQADLAMNAEAARALFGVDGTGVTIGLLSDSYNNLGGAAADIASGDRSAAGVNVLADLASGGSDEGRAMLQLVHDVAPGADLAFSTPPLPGRPPFPRASSAWPMPAPMSSSTMSSISPNSSSRTASSPRPSIKSSPRACPTSRPPATPRGTPTKAPSGLAAGSSAPSSYTISAAGIPCKASPFALGLFSISFQWDQPYASTFTPASPGSASDIDFFIIDSTGTTLLFQSIDNNIGGDPVEMLQLVNAGFTDVNVNLPIGHFSGPMPGLMKYVIFGGGIINEHTTNSATTIGHANAGGAASVGTVRAEKKPSTAFNRDAEVGVLWQIRRG